MFGPLKIRGNPSSWNKVYAPETGCLDLLTNRLRYMYVGISLERQGRPALLLDRTDWIDELADSTR